MIHRRLIAAGLLACALVGAGCGGDDDGGQADRPPPEARPDQFPSAKGKTLVELYNELPAGGPVLAPSLDHFVAGRNRYAFGLFAADRAAIPDAAAKTLYVTALPLTRPGRYEVLGMARLDGRLVAAASARPVIIVKAEDFVPKVGERPPRIHTPTEADVGGDLEQIDTRVPPSSMHESDFADVIGKEPVVLTFATPRLCQSRVCGPVVDVVEQVKS